VAERWAVANGNWSSLATWNGGASLPASGDDVYANNFTVTIDQNVTANSLRIEAGATAVQGGAFTCSGAYTIALQALSVGAHSGASTRLLELAGSTVTLTVAGAITGDSSTTGTEPSAVLITGGTHTINADVTGGAASSASGVTISGATAQATINGDVSGGAGSASYGAHVTGASALLTVIGSVTGGPTAGGLSYGVLVAAGFARFDALLQYGATGCAPVHSNANPIMFKRTGSLLATQAPSDDDWPLATGAAIVVERYTTGNPLPEDVRDGTLYGPGDTSAGTLAVPPASSVAAGVPVDDAVGTAALSLSDLAAVTGAQIAAALA